MDNIHNKSSNSWIKMIEKSLGWLPIIGFVLGYFFGNFYVATEILMGAMVLYWGLLSILKRKMEWGTFGIMVMVLIFGALTLYFRDPIFLKIKVSIIECIIGIVLLVSYFIKKPILVKVLKNEPISPIFLTILTRNYGWFSIGISLLNLIVAYFFSNTAWVWFKLIGLFGLSILFLLLHIPLYLKHHKDSA